VALTSFHSSSFGTGGTNQVLTRDNFPETMDEPCGAPDRDTGSNVRPGDDDDDASGDDGAPGVGETIRRTTPTAAEERIRIPAPGLRLDDPEQRTLWDESRFHEQGGASETIMSDERKHSMEPQHIDHRRRSSSPPFSMRWASGSCTICLGAYQMGDSVTWSSNPDCEHCFHTSCIEEWLLKPRPQKKRVPSRGGAPAIISWVEGDSVPPCPNCRRDFIQDPFEEAQRGTSAVPAGAIDEINL
jgi:Ring finger domain